jgi:hypothetical protein
MAEMGHWPDVFVGRGPMPPLQHYDERTTIGDHNYSKMPLL